MQRYANLKVKTTVANIFVPMREILLVEGRELLPVGGIAKFFII